MGHLDDGERSIGDDELLLCRDSHQSVDVQNHVWANTDMCAILQSSLFVADHQEEGLMVNDAEWPLVIGMRLARLGRRRRRGTRCMLGVYGIRSDFFIIIITHSGQREIRCLSSASLTEDTIILDIDTLPSPSTSIVPLT